MDNVRSVVKPLLPIGWTFDRAEHLTDLWAGYGHIYRLHLSHTDHGRTTKILKIISPPPAEDTKEEGHIRKVLSYRVEANFYRHYAAELSAPCHVPSVFASSSDAVTQTLILQDLAVDFPAFMEPRGTLNDAQIHSAIQWLATFHATFAGMDRSSNLCPPPLKAGEHWNGSGVWEQGGYSYLATRAAELSAIDPNSSWYRLGLNAHSPLAHAIDWCLANPVDSQRLTLVHGDVKAANMAFDPRSNALAMYDFQYVGAGLGVQDLAKFLTTSIPSHHLAKGGEEKLLREYHAILTRAQVYPFEDLWLDWELALVSWVRFQAGWGFWGASVDWLTTRVTALLKDSHWTDAVLQRYNSR